MPAQTQEQDQTDEFAAIIADSEAVEGFFPLYINADAGSIHLQVDQIDQQFLYVTYLSSGVGSNDLGLDRGQIRSTQLVEFRKFGNKLLMTQPNTSYGASSDNRAERRAVREAFAHSVLWGFEIEAEKEGRYLIDISNFLLRPDKAISRSLKSRNEGNFSVDGSRSAIDFNNTKSFPRNTELSVFLTYSGGPAGKFLASVSPNSEAFTVGIRHSFVQLPDEGFEMRPADPRVGYFNVVKYDYAAEYNAPIRNNYIVRHRLEKSNPGTNKSTAKKPITYYLDRGTPEPVRSALLDGARWWNEAFEAAGFVDAFKVELMPENADPLDVRYNVIQWVHRATRGWSYGASVVDPRTGEIIKGHVTLGSLRFRHDYKIAEALLQPYSSPVSDEKLEQAREMAIARLRQLSAHEVGHTLGLLHNFAASAYPNGLGSVMDYPHPIVSTNSASELSLQDAYPEGVGMWDKLAIQYGYSDFGENGSDIDFLRAYISKNREPHMRYISDSDARAAGGAHPSAHLWDNGAHAAEQLQDILDIRRIAIENFSAESIQMNQVMSDLESSFAPIYFFHRYQLEACAKLIGGVEYSYDVRTGDLQGISVVKASDQSMALKAMLRTISVNELTIPEKLVNNLLPPPPYYGGDREAFSGFTDPLFDPVAAAQSAAEMSFRVLVHPNRAARLIQQHAKNSRQMSFLNLLQEVQDVVFKTNELPPMQKTIQRAISQSYVDALITLCNNQSASEDVRAQALFTLQKLSANLSSRRSSNFSDADIAHYAFLLKQIELLQTSINSFESSSTPAPPPGSPIGHDVHIGCDCYTAHP